MRERVCVCMCVCVCARACWRVCVFERMRVCMECLHARDRAHAHLPVRASIRPFKSIQSAPPSTHLHPWLLVQMGHVELAAGRVGQALVVLFQDLVEALRKKGGGRGCWRQAGTQPHSHAATQAQSHAATTAHTRTCTFWQAAAHDHPRMPLVMFKRQGWAGGWSWGKASSSRFGA